MAGHVYTGPSAEVRTGICPTCKRRVRLRPDGITCNKHPSTPHPGGKNWEKCSGYGQEATERTVITEHQFRRQRNREYDYYKRWGKPIHLTEEVPSKIVEGVRIVTVDGLCPKCHHWVRLYLNGTLHYHGNPLCAGSTDRPEQTRPRGRKIRGRQVITDHYPKKRAKDDDVMHEKVECPVCHTMRAIRLDGHFWVHGPWNNRCPGGNRTVAELTGDDNSTNEESVETQNS